MFGMLLMHPYKSIKPLENVNYSEYTTFLPHVKANTLFNHSKITAALSYLTCLIDLLVCEMNQETIRHIVVYISGNY